MKLFLAAALCSVSVSAAFAAEPAMINKVGGKNVLWQHGDTTAAPRVQTLLVPGDRVAAGKDSFAEVEYLADNCMVRVDAGSSVVISETSPCSAPAQKPQASASEDAKVVPASAPVVEVANKTGPVTRVNKGDGMSDAMVGDSLKMGDEVFAGPDSSVTLYFAQTQCSYTVEASSIYKVAEKAPCKSVTAMPTADVPGGTDGDPAVAGAGLGALAAGGITPAVAIGVGVVAIGGAVAIIATTEDSSSNKSPATPD